MIEPRKDKFATDYDEVAESVSMKSVLRDPGFWKEYFYWSWRCLLFVLFIVVATNFDNREGIAGSFEHISATKWAVLVIAPLLFGPLVFVGWSYFWAWGRTYLSGSDNGEQAEKSTLLSKRTRLFLLVCFVLTSQVAAITLWEDLPGESFVDSIGIVFIAIGQWLLMTALTFVIFGIFLKLLFALVQWIYESFYRFPSRRD